MEVYLERLETAKKSLRIADHMLTITHNVVNDPKLFLLVLQKLFNSLHDIVASVLYYERYHKKIPSFNESFDEMFDIFKVRSLRRYNFNTSYTELIHNVYAILKHHKESPIGFAKKGSYVICSKEYETKVLTKELLAQYVEKTKLFIKDAEHMVNVTPN